MTALSRRLLAAFLCACVLGATAAARAAGEAARIVDRARILLEEMLEDPDFAHVKAYLKNAHGAVIVPRLLRGGFVVGGQFGRGVLLVRDPQTGAWSDPIFVTVAGGSLGLQVGGQAMDVVMTVMNRPTVKKMVESEFKLGVDASAALGPVGAGIGAGTTTNFGEDIYVFAKNIGLYAGMSLEGTVIVADVDRIEEYYGRRVHPNAILRGEVHNPHAGSLKALLARY